MLRATMMTNENTVNITPLLLISAIIVATAIFAMYISIDNKSLQNFQYKKTDTLMDKNIETTTIKKVNYKTNMNTQSNMNHISICVSYI
jgi:uncharacterized membrane protein YcaP (DUF421 family)